MDNQQRSQSFLERLAGQQAHHHPPQGASSSTIISPTTVSPQAETPNPQTSLEEEFAEREAQPAPASTVAVQDEWSGTEPSEGQLTLDVYQTDDMIILRSTIAGVQSQDLDVTITHDNVAIKGVRRQPEDLPEGTYFYQECYWGPFSRSVILPVEVESDQAKASIKNGILTIALPKVRKDISRRIQVIEG